MQKEITTYIKNDLHTRKITVYSLFLLILIAKIDAQVVIGSNDPPSSKYNLVELITKSNLTEGKGLQLPKLTAAEIQNLTTQILDPTTSAFDKNAAEGLMVYNTTINSSQIWTNNDGGKWIVIGNAAGVDPSYYTTLAVNGILGGPSITPLDSKIDKIYNDVAIGSNQSPSCGPMPGAGIREASFQNQGKRYYKLNLPTGININDVFGVGKYQDINNIIERVELGRDITNTHDVLIVHYGVSSRENVEGIDDFVPASATIYAMYKDGTNKKRVELTLFYADCMGCGTFDKNGKWMRFMCFDLGANNGVNPIPSTYDAGDNTNPSKPLNGNLYQWGNNISGTTQGGVVTNNIWNAQKGALDPCPQGWRIPTKDEWNSIVGLETKTIIANDNTNEYVMFGDRLFFPASGYYQKSTNSRINTGSHSAYWSSIGIDANNAYGFSVSPGASAVNQTDKSNGLNVRCIAQEGAIPLK